MSHFKNIKGQTFAKELFTSSIESARRGGPMLSAFMQGEVGLGKTALSETYATALAETIGGAFIKFNSPSEFRLEGPEFSTLLNFMKTDEKSVLFVDEVHEVDNTVRHNAFITYLRKALDPRNNGKSMPVFSEYMGDGETREHYGTFDTKHKAIIIATNYSDKADPSGALRSRMQMVELVHYTEDELIEIAQMMFEQEGVNLDETDAERTLRMIARCGRGTARPITNITQRLKMLYGEEEISFAAAIRAIRLCSYFPRGVTKAEIYILQHCVTQNRNNSELLAMLPNIASSDLRKSIAFLSSLDYICARKGVNTTAKGHAFLNSIHKDGFI